MYTIDIVAAYYGHGDVTNEIRLLYRNFVPVSPSSYQFTFTPSSSLFNFDPIPGRRKTFIVLYRVRLELFGSQAFQYSEPRVYQGLEGDEAVLCYDGQGFHSFTSEFYLENKRYIEDASWFTEDIVFVPSCAALDESMMVNPNGPESVHMTGKQLITYPAIHSSGGDLNKNQISRGSSYSLI